jgi:hypothetical protein
MKPSLIIVLLISVCFSAKCQDTTFNKWILKLNTTAFMMNAYVKIGGEKQLSPNLSLSGEMGYAFQIFRNASADTSFVKPLGLSGSIECRYYQKIKKINRKPSRNYWAANLFVISEQYNSGLNFIEIGDTTFKSGASDVLTVDKRKWGVNVIYGKQINLSKRWVLEGYMGLGIRNKNVINSHREFDDKKHEILGLDLVPLFAMLDLSESSGFNVSTVLGLRIGFTLN